MKCTTCRKNELELTTFWQRTKEWFHNNLFQEEVSDLSQNKYTQGFSDGYAMGRKHERQDDKRMREKYGV